MFAMVTLALVGALLVLNLVVLSRLRAQQGSETRLRDEMARGRQQQAEEARALREELAASVQRFASQSDMRAETLRNSLAQSLTELQRDQRTELERSRAVVEHRLQAIQTDNAAKLEQMRQTVDEKLQSTLETRLGESFRMVSERLEQVHKGLGEMQTLAAGVGDLKKVLTNVTTRGAWGEVQLENLLTQMLTPDQFAEMCRRRGTGSGWSLRSGCRVRGRRRVWLPVDAKFPSETYQRLAAAQERGDAEGVEACSKELEMVVKACAKTFSEKYLDAAEYDRFRDSVSGDGGALCGSTAAAWPGRDTATELPGGAGGADDFRGNPEQPADGFPDPGDPAAVGRGVEAAGRREDAIREVFAGAGHDSETFGAGDTDGGRGVSANPGD